VVSPAKIKFKNFSPMRIGDLLFAVDEYGTAGTGTDSDRF
jgi:hypothetical protein